MFDAQLRNRMTSFRHAHVVLALLSVLAATLLILHTYQVFEQTYDECAQMAAGIEWLDHGSYRLDPVHGPLSRVAAAILPYLSGVRYAGTGNVWTDGNAELNWGGHYQRNLTLARLGTLPFFWLSCFLIWRLMRCQFGPWHAALAVFFFAFCPVVLGHSGVATTDAPLMAMFLASVVAFWALIEKPTWTTAIVAGTVSGLGVITKLTEIPFFVFTAGSVWLYAWIARRRQPIPWRLLASAALAMCLTIWAGYRFHHGPILPADSLTGSTLANYQALKPYQKTLLSSPWVPASELFRGAEKGFHSGSSGRMSYLLGQVYRGGRWYFFPVAILAKTPIALLIACFSAICAWTITGEWKRKPVAILLVNGVLGPLAVGMIAKINIGLRHILAIYPFVAMLGAVGAICLWQLRGTQWMRIGTRAAVVLLAAWNLETCLHAAPDLFAYFNEPAAPHASAILVDSDLDWGQDLKRLSAKLEELHARQVSLSILSSADLTRTHLPEYRTLQPGDEPRGWVAISEFELKTTPGFREFESYPYLPVGRSIRLFYFSPGPQKESTRQTMPDFGI
jgi:hypothetical protein